MKKSSANMWHAALLLLIFSMINLAATPFLLAAIGQAAPTLSLLSAACAAGMATLTICARLMDISCTVSTKISQRLSILLPAAESLSADMKGRKQYDK